MQRSQFAETVNCNSGSFLSSATSGSVLRLYEGGESTVMQKYIVLNGMIMKLAYTVQRDVRGEGFSKEDSRKLWHVMLA